MKKGKTIINYNPLNDTLNVIYRSPKFSSEPELPAWELNNSIFFNNQWLLYTKGYTVISEIKIK